MKKLLCMVLAIGMLLSLVACGGGDSSSASTSDSSSSVADDTPSSSSESEEATSYLDAPTDDNEVYDAVFGEFYDAYMTAKETENISERFAKMAIAEAKLLETGVMVPSTSRGGNYAISRVGAKTICSTLWGNDRERFHNAVIADELLTVDQIHTMRDKWYELAGTGEYEQWAKDYLTGEGYTLKDTYNYLYSTDPETWDVLASSQSVDSEAIVNTYDGLLEYDMENIQQPALATSYDISEDGLTYTFHIREGAVWTDSQGRKVADVKADDFVAGMQHMMDVAGGLEYLVDGIIVGATEYINGDTTDFDTVGVKALDDYTLEYTLTAPCSYFITMMGYGVFAPMSRDYYTSQGGKFGAEFDATAADYNYGKTPNNIAYCGPYLVTNYTAKNTIVFSANPTYWNADNINIKTLTWLYNDGSDATKSYEDAKSGVLDGAGLNASALEACKKDGLFEEHAYVAGTDATSYMGFFNLNRRAFANFNDETKAISTQTEDDAKRTHGAVLNQHFRLALAMGLDRGTYNAQSRGEELKYTNLINTYVPGNYVTLEEEVSVDINGASTTFPAGTNYGEIIQAQLDADGVKLTVWNPGAGTEIPSSGYDGWFNAENAKAEMALAIEELAAQGLEITAENPIQIDFTYPINVEVYVNRANVLKQCWEETFDGLVQVNLVGCADEDEWQYTGYFPKTGADMNFDYASISGWSPDYGDPSTYLDTMLPDGAGYMAKTFGLF